MGPRTRLSCPRAKAWGLDWTGCSLSPGLPPSPHPHQGEAVEMMDQIVRWVREDPSGLGRPQLPGALASEPMAVPMMLLNLVEQLGESDQELASNYAELGDWCAQRILRHIQVGSRRLMPGPDRAWALGDRAASSAPTPPPTWALMGRHREARPGQGMAQDPQESGGPGQPGGAEGRREGARAPGTSESRIPVRPKSFQVSVCSRTATLVAVVAPPGWRCQAGGRCLEDWSAASALTQKAPGGQELLSSSMAGWEGPNGGWRLLTLNFKSFTAASQL